MKFFINIKKGWRFVGGLYLVLGFITILGVTFNCPYVDFVEKYGTALTILGLGLTMYFFGKLPDHK